MRITISSDVDTIHLDGAPHVPNHVWGIVKDGIDGWFGTPKVRESLVDIPQRDGAYMPAMLTQSTRVVTIRGLIRQASSVQAGRARERICDLACRKLTLRVEDALGPKESRCFMSGDPEPLLQYNEEGFSFALVLTCPDPLKYGREVSFAPVLPWLEVENAGLAASWPRVRVDGPVSMLRVSCDEGLVEWHGDAGGLDLDFADMQPSSGVVTIGRPWRVRPGTGRYWVDMDGAGDMRMIVRPAWR